MESDREVGGGFGTAAIPGVSIPLKSFRTDIGRRDS
jgi:hypothetical protein